MMKDNNENVSYEQFREEWLEEIKNEAFSSVEKGRRFAVKLVTQWLGITSEDEDFFVCDGPSDGGIDVAYLQRQDHDHRTQDADYTESGDIWYLVQSKYGASFAGIDSIIKDGRKMIDTLQGDNQKLSARSQQLLQKLVSFREQASDADRIVLVFATTDPIAQSDRRALQDIKVIGRERGIHNFDVEEVSLKTIWEALSDDMPSRLSLDISGQLVEQYSGLLVGTVSLIDLFKFLKSYQNQSGNLDQLYEKNVRQFLGNRRKINKGIAKTLRESPEKFGLYNNGITIVVSGYSRTPNDKTTTINDPYIVNGCQTTRTIWEVLDSKLNSGGTGTSAAMESWKERVNRGGVVAKIVKSDDIELPNITRFTNSQNSVREQDFIALNSGFQKWASDLENQYKIYLEIQRGGIESRKALEKKRSDLPAFRAYVNAFDLIKVYGAGWLGVPGLAFNKNAPFLPSGSVYEQMVSRKQDEKPFGADDLYAAYIIKRAADQIGFGRRGEHASRHSSRYLFYHIVLRMLENVILVTPRIGQPEVSPPVLTDAVLKLSKPSTAKQLDLLCKSAIAIIDRYFSRDDDNSIHNEKPLQETYNGNVNTFLKAEHLGKKEFSPLLVQLIAVHNAAMSIPDLMNDQTSRGEFLASALIATT